MKLTKKIGTILLLVVAITTFCGGSSKSIVGKWESADGVGTMEFTKDGKLTMEIEGMTINGTYETKGDTITTKINVFGQESEDVSTFSIKGKTLTITNAEGKVSKFKRIK